MECGVFCREAGEHYSESCPIVPNRDERYNIVVKRGRCIRCMEHCERRGFCSYKDKKCFYCKRVKRTIFEQYTLTDSGHHSALCTIPDRMEEARRELDRMEQDMQQCQ